MENNTQAQLNQGLEVEQVAPIISSPSIIEIGTAEAIVGMLVIIFTAGIAWGTLKTSVKAIKDLLDKNILPDLKEVRERFAVVEDRVNTIWKDEYAPANSPRQLNEKGNTILENSGIKEIIERKKEQLLRVVKSKNTTNAYDAEQTILSVVMDLIEHCPDIEKDLKSGAFKVGASIDSVLFVGGIYLRNLIFEELGFSLKDIDNTKTIS